MNHPVRAAKALLLLAALMPTSGCTAIGNLFDSSDNTAEPAELVEFEPTITVRTVWQRRVGSGAGKLFLKLRPAIEGERVYAATRDGRVRAFDARTCESVWDTDTDSPLSGGRASATDSFCSAPATEKCWRSRRMMEKSNGARAYPARCCRHRSHMAV